MKPILFNSEMVRAILNGHKTVTRRVVKPQPHYEIHVGKDRWSWDWVWWGDKDTHDIKAPYCPGDILYVRETWAPFYETMHSVPVIDYRYYSETDEEIKERLPEYLNWYWPGKWSPSIHMPREAARIFLRVTDVKVERLQDITESQAIAEGCNGKFAGTGEVVGCGWEITPQDEFSSIWNSTIKPKDRTLYGWEANPYVWCVSFEKISKEEAYKCA